MKSGLLILNPKLLPACCLGSWVGAFSETQFVPSKMKILNICWIIFGTNKPMQVTLLLNGEVLILFMCFIQSTVIKLQPNCNSLFWERPVLSRYFQKTTPYTHSKLVSIFIHRRRHISFVLTKYIEHVQFCLSSILLFSCN